MKLIIIASLILAGCATQPTPQSILADLQKVQADAAVLVPAATVAADVAETATGNPALIPLTNAISAAVQAANKAAAVATPPAK